MGQPDTLFTWSETARAEFDALVDGTNASERFRLALAQTIANGWGSNRDKKKKHKKQKTHKHKNTESNHFFGSLILIIRSE